MFQSSDSHEDFQWHSASVGLNMSSGEKCPPVAVAPKFAGGDPKPPMFAQTQRSKSKKNLQKHFTSTRARTNLQTSAQERAAAKRNQKRMYERTFAARTQVPEIERRKCYNSN
ncbi:hypothetical protein AVEN_196347-1 [Araneus ventricosus]|uniref:Uncharacterized protein n=1 Tax=Araneus ventricosus TaxID=182803 RepID=A0A4Y2AXA5_ARAVE|nr:hypothetical protein AVEN_196347-1 [Araneus ventricosus]